MVARDPAGLSSAAPGGVVDGSLAGLGFGLFFVALGQVSDDAGMLPLAVNQLVAGVVIVLVALTLRQPWLPRERAALGGILAGALGTCAAVLTSLYPAFTVVLAASVLREHVHRAQAAGLLLCAVAVSLVAAG
jgi:drug/metabolite transporter (DMT)-like permease